ncbi:asialoglycoprotein receptor 2-like [Pomacea canaliculata]|uniref:asialoglycoprotein receptor 2-like n=1 Tax=Pomacea canaliculata TaxID=400727 RepID=UPI000D737345|nr:asialoglycoprotein receptor 2-like [Pomacea canaliculata]
MVTSAVVIVCLSCFLTLVPPAEADCLAGWMHFNDSCYSFVAKQVAWNEAQHACYIKGGSLVIINSQEEDDFLHRHLQQERRYFYGYDFWVGGKEIPGTDFWEWVDGTLFSQTFTAWATGRPVTGGRAKCLEFEADMNSEWNDDYCDDLDFYICERAFEFLTPSPPPIVG